MYFQTEKQDVRWTLPWAGNKRKILKIWSSTYRKLRYVSEHRCTFDRKSWSDRSTCQLWTTTITTLVITLIKIINKWLHWAVSLILELLEYAICMSVHQTACFTVYLYGRNCLQIWRDTSCQAWHKVLLQRSSSVTVFTHNVRGITSVGICHCRVTALVSYYVG